MGWRGNNREAIILSFSRGFQVIYDVYVRMWRQAGFVIKTHESSGSSKDKEEKKNN